jgi:hypothetical protein
MTRKGVHKMCDHEACNGGTPVSVPMPDKDDPHGWTVAFQILLDTRSIYRAIGWVGDFATAEKVCMVAAMIYNPVLSFGAVPAPRTAEPDEIVAISGRPEAMPDDFPLDRTKMTEVPVEYLRGADARVVKDAMMPTPVLTAAMVVDLLDRKGVDVEAIFDGGRGSLERIQDALSKEDMQAISDAFPTDTMTIGIARDDLPCICGNCKRGGE